MKHHELYGGAESGSLLHMDFQWAKSEPDQFACYLLHATMYGDLPWEKVLGDNNDHQAMIENHVFVLHGNNGQQLSLYDVMDEMEYHAGQETLRILLDKAVEWENLSDAERTARKDCDMRIAYNLKTWPVLLWDAVTNRLEFAKDRTPRARVCIPVRDSEGIVRYAAPFSMYFYRPFYLYVEEFGTDIFDWTKADKGNEILCYVSPAQRLAACQAYQARVGNPKALNDNTAILKASDGSPEAGSYWSWKDNGGGDSRENHRRIILAIEQLKKEHRRANEMSCEPGDAFPQYDFGHVFDAEKSVRWNREELSRSFRAYNEERARLEALKAQAIDVVAHKAVDLIAAEADVNAKQAERAWRYICDTHSPAAFDRIEGMVEFLKCLKEEEKVEVAG